MDKFLRIIQDNLKAVQGEFDKYQKENFTERPSEFFSLELCGEAGELANIEKKAWKGRQISHDRFADEAADVLIALMNYSNARGVDLSSAVCEKIKKIEVKRLDLQKKGLNY